MGHRMYIVFAKRQREKVEWYAIYSHWGAVSVLEFIKNRWREVAKQYEQTSDPNVFVFDFKKEFLAFIGDMINELKKGGRKIEKIASPKDIVHIGGDIELYVVINPNKDIFIVRVPILAYIDVAFVFPIKKSIRKTYWFFRISENLGIFYRIGQEGLQRIITAEQLHRIAERYLYVTEAYTQLHLEVDKIRRTTIEIIEGKAIRIL
ncbi:MAG: hypothetical protein Q6363_009805 [Candidatus Njordarchaeota archaeon]